MNQKLRVLHVTPMYPTPQRPARGTFVKSQIDSLKGIVDAEVHVIAGGQGPLPYLKNLGELRARLKEDFDVIHVHYGNLASMVKILGTGGKPVVTSYCGTDLLGDRPTTGRPRLRDRFYAPLNRCLARQDAQAIVKSAVLARQVESIVESLSIVPNGVDISKFRPMDRTECRERIGLAEEKRPVILFGADPANKIKNFALLEDALSKFLADTFRVLTFAGGIIKHDEIPLYMNAADLVVLTSHHEGSPNVVKEATACGRPVFGTPCGDVEFMLDGVEGSRVIGYNPMKWARAFQHLLDGDLPARNNGHDKLIEKGIDMESIARRLEGIYLEAAGWPVSSKRDEEPLPVAA
ncbi:MAG: glycosyltransferase [Verrucomicrobiota bacterium]